MRYPCTRVAHSIASTFEYHPRKMWKLSKLGPQLATHACLFVRPVKRGEIEIFHQNAGCQILFMRQVKKITKSALSSAQDSHSFWFAAMSYYSAVFLKWQHSKTVYLSCNLHSSKPSVRLKMELRDWLRHRFTIRLVLRCFKLGFWRPK